MRKKFLLLALLWSTLFHKEYDAYDRGIASMLFCRCSLACCHTPYWIAEVYALENSNPKFTRKNWKNSFKRRLTAIVNRYGSIII